MTTGVVLRFDSHRGYGFIRPDDAPDKEVFVHQNDIKMDGFRSLRVGEAVTFREGDGDKGLKAFEVELISPRDPNDDGRPVRRNNNRRHNAGGNRGNNRNNDKVNRLIDLLIELQIIHQDEADSLND